MPVLLAPTLVSFLWPPWVLAVPGLLPACLIASSLPVSASHSQPLLSRVGWEAPEGIDSVLTLICAHALGVERDAGGRSERGMWAPWAGKALGSVPDAVTGQVPVRP